MQLTAAWESFHPNNPWVSPSTAWSHPQGPPGGNLPQGHQRGQIPAAIPFRPNDAVYQRIQPHNEQPYKTQATHSSSTGSLMQHNAYNPNQMTYEGTEEPVYPSTEYFDRTPVGYPQGQAMERPDYQDLHGHQGQAGMNQQQPSRGYQNQQGNMYAPVSQPYYPPQVTQSQYPQQPTSRQQAPQYPQLQQNINQYQAQHADYPDTTGSNQYYQRHPQPFETNRNPQDFQSAHGHPYPSIATSYTQGPARGPGSGPGSGSGSGPNPSAPPMSEY